MFKFTALQNLHRDMKVQNETRTIFSFEFNKRPFSCIFLTDIVPYELYLTSLGDSPFVIKLEIKNGYVVENFIDNYKDLVRYLGIKFDPNYTFKPVDFFKALNNNIPRVFMGRPDYKDILRTVSAKKDIEDVNKIYFCGWKQNNIRYVTKQNIEKTRAVFGDQQAELCKSRNISSCWTDKAKDEDLSKINKKL
ncbi:DUF6037 family protein [Campylobacter sp. 9BO]|uniref:DUF6037 family protein n=1 Tax=Campylobacter sp. 9BO TaxID=3424759 RepID=UPI003D34236F